MDSDVRDAVQVLKDVADYDREGLLETALIACQDRARAKVRDEALQARRSFWLAFPEKKDMEDFHLARPFEGEEGNVVGIVSGIIVRAVVHRDSHVFREF